MRRLLWSGLFAAIACSSNEPADRRGTLTVEWTGADTGKLSAPAIAQWCDSLRLLELRAIRGDTGMAIALYPSDSIKPGDYKINRPERAPTKRPSSGLALRWFAETTIRGFRGDSGSVTLQGLAPDGASGRFSGMLRSSSDGSRIKVTGSFEGVSVERDGDGCVADVSATDVPDEDAPARDEDPPAQDDDQNADEEPADSGLN